MKKILLILLLIFSIGLTSCTNDPPKDVIDEYTVEFDDIN